MGDFEARLVAAGAGDGGDQQRPVRFGRRLTASAPASPAPQHHASPAPPSRAALRAA